MFSARSDDDCALNNGYSNRGTVFSMRSVSRYFKQGCWRNELDVRQSSVVKNVGTDAEDIVGIRHEATTGEDIAN
jgi:hypothetical protein